MQDDTPRTAPIARLFEILDTCVECGAAAGNPCRSPAGRRRRQPHPIRVLTRGIGTLAVVDLALRDLDALTRMMTAGE